MARGAHPPRKPSSAFVAPRPRHFLSRPEPNPPPWGTPYPLAVAGVGPPRDWLASFPSAPCRRSRFPGRPVADCLVAPKEQLLDVAEDVELLGLHLLLEN